MPSFFTFQEFFDAEAVNFAHHKVEIVHPSRTIFLTQEDIPVDVPQHLQQNVVGG